MSIGTATKAVVLPMVALAECTDSNDHQVQDGGAQRSKAKYLLAYIINLALAIGAGYLAWTCNAGQTMILRVVYTILGAMFSGLYLIYYFIYRILMKNAC